MSKVKDYTITWTKSTSVDVVGYKVYYVPETETLNYSSPNIEVGNVDAVKIPADVPDFPLIDGIYQIGLSAIDDVGNESDIAVKTVPFDLVAPDAPTNLEVTAG